MKSVNTYSIPIKGLRKASGNTCNYGDYSAEYEEIFYNRSTGEVWTCYQVSLGDNSWTVYDDPAVVKICNSHNHMSMQQIADAIRDTLAVVGNA